MGKRSRKRAVSGEAPAARVPPVTGKPAAPHAHPIDRRARSDEAPPAPWSPFPLIEICIFIGLILIIVGFVAGGDRRGTMLVFGFVLVSLSALELSVREHFSGFRSHTTLIAGVCALAASVPLFMLTSIPQLAILVIAAVVFGLAVSVLRAAFARRTGGLGFRA